MNTPSGKTRILVAMSGGVDSSVTACLLREQGYDVVGVFMRLGAEPVAATCDPSTVSLPIASDQPDRHRGCCSALDATDARVVAGKLGIPFYALNFQEDFAKLIDYFADEYAVARTPNPCVRCNQWLKFGKLIAYADAINADLIATGHYARVDIVEDRPRLRRAVDSDKDQSYVLFGIAPEVLCRTLFPLGGMTKPEVRAHARRFGIAVHDKPDSQDICFVPDRQYARVVQNRRPDAFIPGEIRHVDGRVLGSHTGIPNFTVGQRRGLNIAVGSPVYVTDLDADSGTVTVGPQESVYESTVRATSMQWLTPPPAEPFRANVRIRYNHDAAPALVHTNGDDTVEALFDDPQWAVTPGQAMVIYDEDEVLGGGWIE